MIPCRTIGPGQEISLYEELLPPAFMPGQEVAQNHVRTPAKIMITKENNDDDADYRIGRSSIR